MTEEGEFKKAVGHYLELWQNSGRGVYHRLNAGIIVLTDDQGKARAFKGVKPGASDYIVIRSVCLLPSQTIMPEVFWLELKSRTGKQSEAQKEFQALVESIFPGCYHLVRSMAEVQYLLPWE